MSTGTACGHTAGISGHGISSTRHVASISAVFGSSPSRLRCVQQSGFNRLDLLTATPRRCRLGDIKACFLCPPPTDTSDSLPQAEASDSNSLIHEPLEAEGHSLGTAHLDAEPLSMGDGDDDAEEDQALANVETRGLIVEPIATGTEEGQVAPQLIVEPVDDEEEPQGQPGGRRLARRLLA